MPPGLRADSLGSMTDKPSILVVEDETAIREGLVDVLVYHGYAVDSAADGHEGLRKSVSGRFDLILLDIMLPGVDGYAICDAIRQQDARQPVIMLTAKTSDDDIVQGLKLGADDYVSKPFSVQQLVLRIQAVLRRSDIGVRMSRRLQLGELAVDTENLSAIGPSGDIAFTRREMDVLQYLAANTDRPVSREELLLKVWGYGRNIDIETRTVDIHIAKLRRKIEPSPAEPAFIVTVRGAGYRLITDP